MTADSSYSRQNSHIPGTEASVCYDICMPCSGTVQIDNIYTADSCGLSLVPGIAADDSGLACLGFSEKLEVPNCANTVHQNFTAAVENPCRILPYSSGNFIPENDLCTIIPSICTSTSKKSDISAAYKGDIITYTITFTNHSPIPLDMIRIFDRISPGASLIPDSIHPVPEGGESLETGISLERVDVECSVVLTYKVIVDSCTPGQIINHAQALFFYQDCRGCLQYGVGSGRSCRVNVLPCKPEISITKSADKTWIFGPCEEIAYSLTVSNSGETVLTDVVIYDDIPAGLCYKSGSTSRNGGVPANENPQNGILIGSLKPGEAYIISFVLCLCASFCCDQYPVELINTARARGFYSQEEIFAVSNPWTVTFNRICLPQCIVRCLSIPDFQSFRGYYVYQTGTVYSSSLIGGIVETQFGIQIKYIDQSGTKKNMNYSDRLIFHNLPHDFSLARFYIRLTRLCCRNISCGSIAASFTAELVYPGEPQEMQHSGPT